MTTNDRPDQVFADIVRQGLETLKTTIEGVTTVIRSGDTSLRDLDNALTGRPVADVGNPDEAFLQVVALMQAAMQEAHEHGSATSPEVVQKAREMLSRITKEEPAWRPGPTVVKTINDAIRVALRDLRASKNLLSLARGQGSLDDLESLTQWADDFSKRMNLTQQMIAQPKPQPVAETPSQPVISDFTPVRTEPESPPPKKKKRNTTPKNKPNPDDVTFAKAVAAEFGDTKVIEWAQQFENGKISEKQWISRLTNHAAATRDSLDDVFARAHDRMAQEAGG